MPPESVTNQIVLVVLFASTLGIAVGLRHGIQTARCRRLADAHALASLAGMALALSPLAPSPLVAWLAQALGLGAQLMMLRGTAALGLPVRVDSRLLQVIAVVTLLWLALIAAACDPSSAVQLIPLLGHAATAAVVWQALRLLTEDRRGERGLGHALFMVAGCAQLAGQLLSVAHALSVGGATVAPYPWQVQEAGWLAQAPLLLMLIASVCGMVGFTIYGAERLVAEQAARARLDPLTGLLHRGALEQAALSSAAELTRHHKPLCCLAIDVDHFKKVNDLAGHQAGDAVLMRIAQVLHDTCRASDIVARFGGEEFCLLCPGTGIDEATVLAERIRARIATIGLPGALGGHASVSIGVAEARRAADARQCWEQLFGQADRALYRAKREGRNRVVRASQPVSADGAAPAWADVCGVSVGG